MLNTYNILLIGHTCSGKTALAIRYINDTFIDDYDETIDDTYEYNEEDVSFRVIDSSGKLQTNSPNFKQLIKEADAFILTYDLTNIESWLTLQTLIAKLELYQTNRNAPKVLVGTKLDKVSERQITTLQGIELSFELACPFFETSSLSCFNINNVFSNLKKQLLASKPATKDKTARRPSKQLSRLVCDKFNYVAYKCKLSSILY